MDLQGHGLDGVDAADDFADNNHVLVCTLRKLRKWNFANPAWTAYRAEARGRIYWADHWVKPFCLQLSLQLDQTLHVS